jgi:hypothetical protein
LEEIEEGVFDGAVAKAKGRAIRSDNYTEFEDVILIKAWEAVSMDDVTGTDQACKSYWQRIKEMRARAEENRAMVELISA